jgi:hypothetical protein
MKVGSEEYDEDDSSEDQDEIAELTGMSDNSCLVAADFDDMVDRHA